MDLEYKCRKCDLTVPASSGAIHCHCGGLYDLAWAADHLVVDPFIWSQFRYHEAMPVGDGPWQPMSLGEGMTPLVQLDASMPGIFVKQDYMMPTGSFKDRGAVIMVAKALEYGAQRIIQDSSGNAGTSVAAYAARAGIPCDIYIPVSTTENKATQIEVHGATVHRVEGSREDTARAAYQAAQEEDVYYASHVYNPFFHQGTKTYAFEIVEQLGRAPDTLVVPVGNGTLLIGAWIGFSDMLRIGQTHRMPRIIAVQSEGCAPIYEAFVAGADTVQPADNTGTTADGIAIADPKRGDQILHAIRDTGGIVVKAPENQIMPWQAVLAEKGFYVEPTTAATFAGFDAWKQATDEEPGITVLPLCGTGLKL